MKRKKMQKVLRSIARRLDLSDARERLLKDALAVNALQKRDLAEARRTIAAHAQNAEHQQGVLHELLDADYRFTLKVEAGQYAVVTSVGTAFRATTIGAAMSQAVTAVSELIADNEDTEKAKVAL